MRIINQCSEAEARRIFATPCDKSDVWVGYSKDGFQGMASYSVCGYTIGGPVKSLFAVEDRFPMHCWRRYVAFKTRPQP